MGLDLLELQAWIPAVLLKGSGTKSSDLKEGKGFRAANLAKYNKMREVRKWSSHSVSGFGRTITVWHIVRSKNAGDVGYIY